MDSVPSQIGPYQLLEPLGQGAMGVVYRARHTVTGHMAALKTVRLTDETVLQSLRREIHALARLSHPGIVRILDQGVHAGLPWYAMEFIEGPTLRQYLRHLPAAGRPEPAAPTGHRLTEAPETSPAHNPAAFAPETQPTRRPAAFASDAPETSPAYNPAALPAEAPETSPAYNPAAFVPETQPTRRPAAFASDATRTPFSHNARTGLPANPPGSEQATLRPHSPQQPPNPAPPSSPRPRRLDPDQLQRALQPILGLCSTLAFLHGEGLVHRDLKPDNILMRREKPEERIPVLADFGLAAPFRGDRGREELGPAGLTVGTAAYMAPEQVRGELVDARADLYALGCILYEIVTGTLPFRDSSLGAILWKHVAEPPVAPSRLVEGVPPRLDALILRLMQKQPQQRYGHADDIASVLQELTEAPARGPSLPRPRAYLYRPGFTGRAQELMLLEDRLRSRQGGFLRIAGESGSGKTRLLLELERKAGELGIPVLTSQSPAPLPLDPGKPEALASSGPGALASLREALRQIADRCRARGVEETQNLLGPRSAILAPYEPALWELPGQAPPPATSEEVSALPADAARLRLFTALTDTFLALASAQPLVLVLDDLQWADELTLGWLAFLLRTQALQGTSLLVVAAHRTDDSGAAGLSAVPEFAQAQPPLLLGRLDQTEVGDMAAQMLGLSATPTALARFLAEQSEGNPLFVVEWLHAVVAEGLLVRGPDGYWQIAPTAGQQVLRYEDLPLPGSLLELVQHRLEGLTPEALALAEAAAVLGREMSQTRLLRLGATQRIRPLDALEELVRRQILEEPPTDADRLRFAHDKLREAAYGRLTPMSRQTLHRAAAEAIVEAYGQKPLQDWDEDLEALGRHWEEAGEPRRAQHCYRVGGRRASLRFAHAESERLYRAFLRLEQTPEADGIRVRCEMATDVLCVSGRTEQAAIELRQARENARILQLRDLEAKSLQQLGFVLFSQGRMEEARDLYQQALTVATEVGDLSAQLQSLRNLGVLDEIEGRIDQARQHFQEALLLTRQRKRPGEEASVLGDLGVLESKQGRFEESWTLTQQSLALSRGCGDRLGEASNLGNLAILCRRQGRLHEACLLAEEAVRICKETGYLRSEAMMMANLANLYVDLGLFQPAATLYRQARAAIHQVGDQRTEVYILLFQAALQRRTAPSPEAAIPFLEEAEQLRLGFKSRALALAALCERGHLQLALGRRPEAELQEISSICAAITVGSQGAEGRALTRFQQALAAFDEGRTLQRGERPEDLPESLRTPSSPG